MWFGLLAALGAAGVAGDAWANATKYPILHRLFGQDWDVARNALYAIASTMAAAFGYLALNYKEPDHHGSSKKEP